MSLISLMDYSVSQVNPSFEDPIDGFGNYNLQVHGPYGSALANSSVLSLFFLDSGDRVTVDGRRTYGWIRNSQLDWLQHVSEKQDALGLGFFHIPIPEIKQLYYQKIVGEFQEAVACSSVNSQVLEKLVAVKNVKAVFIGHDHTNDFCGNLDGIWFCYGGGSGYHGYGKVGWSRRARVIHAQLSKKDSTWVGLERLTTWKRLDDKMLSKIDKQLLWSHES
ncbi:hypothetical protein KSS87_017437 [Heliosperma pusillum]|nr:hypothetical protein KSS87_017437 [Heliosperma pusillum]